MAAQQISLISAFGTQPFLPHGRREELTMTRFCLSSSPTASSPFKRVTPHVRLGFEEVMKFKQAAVHRPHVSLISDSKNRVAVWRF